MVTKLKKLETQEIQVPIVLVTVVEEKEEDPRSIRKKNLKERSSSGNRKTRAHNYGGKTSETSSGIVYVPRFNESASDSEESHQATAHMESYSRRSKKRSGNEVSRAESSRTHGDVDGEPEDIATRLSPYWEGVAELRRTYYLFRNLISYTTYRLLNAQTNLSPKRRTAIKRIYKNIPPKLKKDNTFTSTDGVLVLESLAKIVQELNIQEMNEGQAIRILPEFLDAIALMQFNSVSQTCGSLFG